MRNIWTIAKREYSVYFNSPLAYVVMLLIFATVGIIFALNLLSVTSNPFYTSVPDASSVTGPLAFILLFATPAITMRLIADENRTGTMELLLTAPVRDWELIVGKWLGAFLFVLTAILFTLIFPFMWNSMASPGIDQLQMISSYLGIILVAAAFLGIGVGISAIFSNQFAAFFTTMGILVIMWWLIGAPATVLQNSGTIGEVFKYLDMNDRFYNAFNQGIVNLSDIVYYLSLTALGLFTGTISVEIRRWR